MPLVRRLYSMPSLENQNDSRYFEAIILTQVAERVLRIPDFIKQKWSITRRTFGINIQGNSSFSSSEHQNATETENRINCYRGRRVAKLQFRLQANSYKSVDPGQTSFQLDKCFKFLPRLDLTTISTSYLKHLLTLVARTIAYHGVPLVHNQNNVRHRNAQHLKSRTSIRRPSNSKDKILVNVTVPRKRIPEVTKTPPAKLIPTARDFIR